MLEKIILDNASVIWSIAKKFYGVPKEDLYQAGVVGLINAYESFDKTREAKFSTYAYMYIYGEMYKLASQLAEIKLSKDALRLLKMIDKAYEYLEQKMLRNPSKEELASFLEMDLDTFDKLMQYKKVFVSLDEEKDGMRDLHESTAKEERVSVDDKILLKESMSALKKEERDIIRLRYFNDLTQSEIAKLLNISQVKVSRYESRTLKKMRDFMYTNI